MVLSGYDSTTVCVGQSLERAFEFAPTCLGILWVRLDENMATHAKVSGLKARIWEVQCELDQNSTFPDADFASRHLEHNVCPFPTPIQHSSPC